MYACIHCACLYIQDYYNRQIYDIMTSEYVKITIRKIMKGSQHGDKCLQVFLCKCGSTAFVYNLCSHVGNDILG